MILAHYNSIGNKSGEYGGKNFTLAPIDAIKKLLASPLSTGKLFITTIAPTHNWGRIRQQPKILYPSSSSQIYLWTKSKISNLKI
ncbi:hypothetical protein D0A34_22550 [Microcoleus vaginatus PCC 9802]|nr:hypothetical protein D0A34_22550 [Microcoleus vaginatus PCC 9802]